MATKKWLGSEQQTCDACHEKFSETFFDAKTPLGPWALLCERCFNDMGCKLGLGRGQQYDLLTKEKIGG